MAKKHKDFITEEDYTLEMANAASTRPEDDSPGDSEFDADTETEMGLNFETDLELDEEDFDEAEGLVSSNDTATGSYARDRNQRDLKLPESAEVVSSEKPAPRLDENSDTAIH
ncbi:MAG: hypothetical protein KF767_06605 [Bdellovibrionaceae bacterium]|nr:hypothetical protein [Pseudobdellovibrionaceae bacterium]